ncbi:MAG: GNAT family N-acetyltransferase [Okeania sp. SIO1I7]|nr:GNAT family N-acetyltransferase [Okeania sp. SIO1I7]
MSMLENLNIRTANLSENYIIAEHLYKMWQDIGVPTDDIESNWLEITKEYIDNARKKLFYQAFIAEINNTIVGSVSCQILAGLYPNILKPKYRKYGYIWGVYVEANYRRQGIAKKLIGEAIAYLKSISCTKAILHASPQGKPLYSHLGFDKSNEMWLDLS